MIRRCRLEREQPAVIAGLAPAIQRLASAQESVRRSQRRLGVCGALATGDKPRYDKGEAVLYHVWPMGQDPHDNADAVTGVILAGGQSRRMGGGDKGLLDLAGRPMLAHVIQRLSPQVGRLLINANGDPARLAGFDLPVVADTLADFPGPLAGVLAGMRWSRANAPEARWIATAAGDAPLLPFDLVARCLEAVADRPGAIALAQSAGELHPVIGLWPVALADDLQAGLAAGVRKVLTWTDRHGTVAVPFPMLRLAGKELDPFFNANTPQDLDRLRAILAQTTP